MSNDSTVSLVTALRDVGKDFGADTSFALFASLQHTLGPQAQASIFQALLGVGEIGFIVVCLEKVGEKKINIIKHYRAATGAGLKEAKDFVEDVQPMRGELERARTFKVESRSDAEAFVQQVRADGGHARIII